MRNCTVGDAQDCARVTAQFETGLVKIRTLLGERHQSGYFEKPRVQKVREKASRKGAKAQSL